MAKSKTLKKRTAPLLRTPRPYLSWSQLDCWERDPEEYKRRYIYGEFRTSEAMELGKSFAQMLQADKPVEDPVVETLRIFLASYPFREHKLEGVAGGVPILGILDGFKDEPLAIGEYKTGRTPWTLKMAMEHGQLDFYSLLVWVNYKKLPAFVDLHWCPTMRDDEGNLVLTGDIRSFTVPRDMKQVLRMIPRIQRAWAGIQEMTTKEYSLIG